MTKDLSQSTSDYQHVPFLGYQYALSEKPPVRMTRGYDLKCWEYLSFLEDVANAVNVKNPQISKRIISAGPCQWLWRIYYSTICRENLDLSFHDRNTFLGFPIQTQKTKIELGCIFEKWIRDANVKYNELLNDQNHEILDEICIQEIREWYKKRAIEHFNCNAAQINKTEMDIDPKIGAFPGSLIPEQTPDGLFGKGIRGAIFESKLSMPKYTEFNYQIVAYALLAEKCIKEEKGRIIDMDYAIVLHCDYSNTSAGKLTIEKRTIEESYTTVVLRNIYLFGKLVQYSLGARSENFTDGGGHKVPLSKILPFLRSFKSNRFKNWQDLIVRPAGLPSVDGRIHCKGCQYQKRCYEEGENEET